jgi:phage-related minor tail protein
MSDLRIQGEVAFESNADQVFGRIEQTAGRMAQAVGQSGEQAVRGLDGIGDAAAAAAAKQDKALSGIASSIKRSVADTQRAIAELDSASAGGKGTPDYFEKLGSLKGLDPAAIQAMVGPLRDLQAQYAAMAKAERDAVEAANFERQHQDARKFVKDAEYVRMWTQALEEKEAAEKKAAGQNSFLQSLKDESAQINKTRADLLEMKAAQLGVAEAAAPYIAQLRQVEQGQKNTGMSAAAMNAALRGIPAQFTDIITSLQGGQRPITVLMQQGGQLKDMFGGIGPAARAMGGYILGLVNPLTLTAGAVAVLGYAFTEGQKEMRAFQNAATLTGNAIGLSANGFAQLRDQIAGISTKGKAAEVLTEIASRGEIAGDAVRGIAEAAILMEKATGLATSKTIEQFAELAKSPSDAAEKLNQKYNFLTAAVYKQIKALEDQGRTQQAANLAEQTYADALKARAQVVIDNAGLIERAWRGVTGTAKDAWDAILGIGRPATNAEQIATLQRTLSDKQTLNKSLGIGDANGDTLVTSQLKQQINLLAEQERYQRRAVESKAESNRLAQMGIAFEKQGDEFKTKAQKRDEEILKARTEGQQLVNAGIITEQELTQRLSLIRQKYNETVGLSDIAQQRANKRVADEEGRRLQQSIDNLDFSIPLKMTEAEVQVIKIEEQLATSIMGAARARKEQELVEAKAAVEREKTNQGLQNTYKWTQATVEAVKQQVQAIVQQAQAIEQQAEEQEAANLMFGKGKTAIEEYRLAEDKKNLALAQSRDRDEQAAAALDLKTKAQERYVKALQEAEYKQENLKLKDAGIQAQAEADSLQLEISLLGQTQLVRQTIIGQRKVEIDLAKQLRDIEKLNLGDGPEAEAKREDLRAKARANAVIEASNVANKAVLDDWQRTTDQINSSLTDALLRGFESGKDFATNFRDTLKNMFSTLVLRPVISAVLNPVSQTIAGLTNGIVAGAGQAVGLGGVGASSIAGSVGNSVIGGYLGVSGYGAATATTGTIIGGASVPVGTALATDLTGQTVIAGAAGGGVGGLSGALAGLGPVGWAAIAAAAAYAIFGGQGGGPKNIGAFSTNSSLYDATRTDATAASNQAAQTVAQGIVDSYTAAVTALGIKGGKLDAAVLTSIDDKNAGDAMTALVTQAFLNGQRIYDRENASSGSDAYKNVGRSPEELAAAIKEASADALLSALKASDLTGKMAEYFAKLDPLQLNADQIQAAITAAQNAQSLYTVLGNLGPAFKSVADLSVEAITNLSKAYSTDPNKFATDLQAFYTNFTPAGEQRNNAVNSVVAGLNAAGVNVTFDQVANATAEQVNGLMQTLVGMGDAGKDGAFALLSLNGVLKQIVDTATHAPTAEQVAQNALNVRAPGFLSDAERSQIVGSNIQSKLAAAGVNVSIADILGADAAKLSAFYHSLQDIGNTSAAQVVVDFADSLLALSPAADQATHALGGIAEGFDKALSQAQANIAAHDEFMRQIANLPAPGQGSIDAATANLADLHSQLQQAYQQESATLKQTVDAHLSAADSLKAARIALDTGAQNGLNVQQRYAVARDALSGATPENASGLVSTYLDAAKNNARSSIDYLRDVASGRNLLKGLEDKERDAASVAQRQVDAMAALIDPLVGVQKSLDALRDEYQRAQLQLDLANLGQQTAFMSQTNAAQLFDNYFADLLQKYGGTEEGLSASLYGKGLSAQSLQAYLKTLPGYAVGTSYVPETGPAILHRGEAVIPAALNGAQNDGALLAEMRAMRAEIAAMRKAADSTADSSRDSANVLKDAVLGNRTLKTEAA